MYEFVKVEHVGAVGRITLARENARNAQNFELLDELHHAFEAFRGDDAIRVVILAALGPHFSSGHDLKEAKAKIPDITVEYRWQYEERKYFDYCMSIWDFPKPTIAQVQGGCIAAGFMLANMCDLVVASEDAFFSDPVVHSLAAAATEVLIHPWVMGLRKAKEMLYTGTRIGASEALRIGLVNSVVPNQSLEEHTIALARSIAKAPPFALQLVKRSLNRALDVQGLRVALAGHFDLHQLSHKTEEYLSERRRRVARLSAANADGQSPEK